MMGILLFGLALLLSVAFISSIDDVILMDYVEFFSMTSALVEIGICSATIVIQQTKLFELIDRFEALINKSRLISYFVHWNFDSYSNILIYE